MKHEGLAHTMTAGAAIGKFTIVKFDTTDYRVIQASAAADLAIGVADLGATAAEDAVDVFLEGVVKVVYGGNVTRGQALTADASGRAIAAAPAATATQRIIGIAMLSGVSGDEGSVLLRQGAQSNALNS